MSTWYALSLLRKKYVLMAVSKRESTVMRILLFDVATKAEARMPGRRLGSLHRYSVACT